MSIMIKGMEMPPSCRYCEFRHMSLTQNAFCTAAHKTIDYMAERTKRLNNCPLVPVPPHGRLIDEQWLKDAMITALEELIRNLKKDRQEMYLIASFNTLRVMVENAPTIIEAEE